MGTNLDIECRAFLFVDLHLCYWLYMRYFPMKILHHFRMISFPFVFTSMGLLLLLSSLCPIIKDFVEKNPSTLGSQVNEPASLDNTTGARTRLNSAHFVASLSFKFL